MPERKEIKRYIWLIWLGVIVSLLGVTLIAINLNRTLKRESESAFKQNLKFLSESSAKSIQLFFDGVISEMVLLTEIDAVKKYKSNQVDIAFRGVISKHGERISHMILLNDTGQVQVMVTKDPEPFRMKPQIERFFKETMVGWRVNIAKELFISETYKGIAIGMPIFRKTKETAKNRGQSQIYASGMVMALIGVNDLVTQLVDPIRIEKSGFAWLYTQDGDVISNESRISAFAKRAFGPKGTKDKLQREFGMAMKGKVAPGWSFINQSNHSMVVNFGREKWLITTAKIKMLDQEWTLAVAAPSSEATRLLNQSFVQSISLIGFAAAILLLGGTLMLRLNKRRIRAEEKATYTNELEEKNRSLKELNLRMDEFIAVVSHDIRSPLNVIRGFVKIIRTSPDGSVFQRETNTMLRSCNRLMQLVNDILDVSKLEAGAVALSYDLLEIDDIITESVKTMELSANEKGQEIVVNLSGEPSMEGDGAKLLQVMNNLLGNAIKFTPKNGKISITKHVENKAVIISVSDTGPGIPEEDQDMVFDKFEQTKRHQQGIEPGSGLGLTICKNIVNLHEGEIGVESRPGEGSTFNIVLPQQRPSVKNGVKTTKSVET